MTLNALKTKGILLIVICLPQIVLAQREATSSLNRYYGREKTSTSYEKYEVKPRAHLPITSERVTRRNSISVSSTGENVRIRKYLADAHTGLRFYASRSCLSCHRKQGNGMHTVREKVTCRQCHGKEPIAGIQHYYSPMNQRRRYAFVCAKCHEGASASFATYVIHPPNPASRGVFSSFPELAIGFWLMIALAGGTFLVFLPHTIAWGIRELFEKHETDS